MHIRDYRRIHSNDLCLIMDKVEKSAGFKRGDVSFIEMSPIPVGKVKFAVSVDFDGQVRGVVVLVDLKSSERTFADAIRKATAEKTMNEAYIIEEMMGQIFQRVYIDNMEEERDRLTFESKDLLVQLYHRQGCCESVRIEDIAGDIEDLQGSPITMAECVKVERGEHQHGTYTSTWYKFATVKGYVTVRWMGESNGYYSEEVDLRIERK